MTRRERSTRGSCSVSTMTSFWPLAGQHRNQNRLEVEIGHDLLARVASRSARQDQQSDGERERDADGDGARDVERVGERSRGAGVYGIGTNPCCGADGILALSARSGREAESAEVDPGP